MAFTAHPDLRFHHIGLVVPKIEDFRVFYLNVLRYRERTPIIHDPVQTAYVQFFSLGAADHYLELVAPDSLSSKLQEASRKGRKLNHLCYSCENTAAMVSFMEDSGCFVVQNPVPAVAFDGRLVAWLMPPDGLMTEIVERGPEGSL